MAIHSSAVVEEGAQISKDAEIGAFCFVGKHVKLGKVALSPHVVIEGRTEIADGTSVGSFACLGGAPQIDDLDPQKSGALHIGKDCVIREHVTINCGSPLGRGTTAIGDHCLLMIGCHVAHDCQVGGRVILANGVALAGHVEVGDFAVIGGLCGVHQRVRIGHHAMVGFLSAVDKDVIPYGLIMQSDRAHLEHLNWRRMKGKEFGDKHRHIAKQFFDELFKSGIDLRQTAEALLPQYKGNGFAEDILQFILHDSNRKIATPRSHS